METQKSQPQKSIFDMTDAELNAIDKFQTQNRGFQDEDDFKKIGAKRFRLNNWKGKKSC